MEIQKLIYRKTGSSPQDVFLVLGRGKYGLISMPGGTLNGPDFPGPVELPLQGGSFLTLTQWDEIRANLFFVPDTVPGDRAHDANGISCDYYVLKDGRWGILNEAGCLIQDPMYDEVRIVNLSEEAVAISFPGGDDPYPGELSGCVLVRRDSQWGMLGRDCRVILPLEYDSIRPVLSHWLASSVYIVSKDGIYGVTDSDGQFLIPMQYPPLCCSSLDYLQKYSVFRIDSDTGTGYVRLGDGKCTVDPVWDQVETDRLYLLPDEEPAGCLYTVWKEGRCGLIFDDQGIRIPPLWDEIIPRRIRFLDPASYSVRRGNVWGCCDAAGHLICEPRWEDVGIFLNGMACVRKDGLYGVIGADGKLLIPVEWDEIARFDLMNSGKKAFARTNAGRLLGQKAKTPLPDFLLGMRRNGLWGLMDAEGHLIAEPQWPSLDI